MEVLNLYEESKSAVKIEILPPIEKDGIVSVIGVTVYTKDGTIEINHHTRAIDGNKENGDFTKIVFYEKHLQWLAQKLTDLNKSINEKQKS